MLTCLVLWQLNQVRPEPTLLDEIRKYAPVDTPVRFMTSLAFRASAVGHVSYVDNATLWTVYGSPSEFKIVRRDAIQDEMGRSASRVAVLWTEQGAIHFWSRSEEPSADGATFVSTVSNDTPSPQTQMWHGFGMPPHGPEPYQDMIHSREQQSVFGYLGWLDDKWRVNGLSIERSSRDRLYEEESAEWGRLRYFSNERRTSSINDELGHSMTEEITNSAPMKFKHSELAKAIRFVPPK